MSRLTVMFPERSVPRRSLVQLVVVADTELLPSWDVLHRHHAHDVPEPGVPELGEPAVVAEWVVDLVSQTSRVHTERLLTRENVQISLSSTLYPVVTGHYSDTL